MGLAVARVCVPLRVFDIDRSSRRITTECTAPRLEEFYRESRNMRENVGIRVAFFDGTWISNASEMTTRPEAIFPVCHSLSRIRPGLYSRSRDLLLKKRDFLKKIHNSGRRSDLTSSS